ncbi:hypothetical protein UFOVP446_4 [uncultured Caudovirales phage]|uniref:Uncharacterized protein n=1 Tax=uncultured Caudovirales phage TaxID=2100421 RepID=A0A6J5NXE5_9CAUD|nr:hypothetical protein UFOVP446_4 [uncultured Caudovirales phage]CAB4159924.1 hypothetical protein UFOVP725_13 [uncultured Caudovirales phage]
MATANDFYVSVNNERTKLVGDALAAYLADQEQLALYEAELKKVREDKEAARLAVLEKLGITAEEAKILLQ